PSAPPLRRALRATKSAILPICRTNGSIHTTLSAPYQKGPLVGPFRYVAERVGFEPTVRLPVLLISSQAHSTTLAPLLFSGRTGGASLPAWRASFHANNLSRVHVVRAPSPEIAVCLTTPRRGTR